MKGLLNKDFRLLMGQKQFFLTVVGLGILFTFVNGDSLFAVPYVAMMMCMFTLSTISYDEHDNGGAYLFSLPVTRKVYVAEKYIYGLLLFIASLIVTSIFSIIVMAVKQAWIGNGEFIGVLGAEVLMVTLVLGVTIPSILKFGPEKGRIALMGIGLVIFIAIYAFYKFRWYTGIDIEQFLTDLSGMEPAVAVVVLCGISLVILAVSYMVSLHIMKKKEY